MQSDFSALTTTRINIYFRVFFFLHHSQSYTKKIPHIHLFIQNKALSSISHACYMFGAVIKILSIWCDFYSMTQVLFLTAIMDTLFAQLSSSYLSLSFSLSFFFFISFYPFFPLFFFTLSLSNCSSLTFTTVTLHHFKCSINQIQSVICLVCYNNYKYNQLQKLYSSSSYHVTFHYFRVE